MLSIRSQGGWAILLFLLAGPVLADRPNVIEPFSREGVRASLIVDVSY